jgi:alpha/beta superfamily hydrolase
MAKKIYDVTGITSVGANASIADQRVFRENDMAQPIRPSTVLPAIRTPFTVTTADGQILVGEVAAPIDGGSSPALLMLHPNPTGGGMMDSHIYKKAANRLPAMAGITIVRFNTRGTTSEAGTSTGTYNNGDSEKFDVEAMTNYCFDQLKIEELWVCGWSFGTDLAIRHARDARIKGLILLSPPLKYSQESDLDFWVSDMRPITALIPEFDDYLVPEDARKRFAKIKHMKLIAVDGGKHLWVGEPAVHTVLTEITRVIAPERLPLTQEIDD